jgi:hypothetical protein
MKKKKNTLLWWSGFSGGVGAVLKNVWQNSFTSWIEMVKSQNYLCLHFSLFSPHITFW